MNISECYKVLGLEPGASVAEVRQAYRRLVLKYHPDKDSSEKDGDRFKVITDAYQSIRDDKRPEPKPDLQFSDMYPEEAVSLFDKAEVLFAKHKYFEASALYDRATDLLPRYEKAWLRKGDCLYNLKKYGDALGCYAKASEINPESMTAWNLKGVCLSGMKRYGEALDAFDEAIMLNPRHEAIWNFRGVCLYAMKRLDEALDSFDRAIKINQNFAPAWKNKGKVLLEAGNEKEGKRCVEQAKKLHP